VPIAAKKCSPTCTDTCDCSGNPIAPKKQDDKKDKKDKDKKDKDKKDKDKPKPPPPPAPAGH
jgi:hypothetical protein